MTPEPHGAMADSGIVPSFPLYLKGGWFVGDLVASQGHLSTFRDELNSAGSSTTRPEVTIPGIIA